MEVNQFLNVELLGKKYVAVKGYEPVLDRETGAITDYRVNLSLQDESSKFYYEMISVKVKNTNPTLSVEQMKTNNVCDVEPVGLNMGQFNGKIWITCDDILPVNSLKKDPKINN
ncbi:hypothetical protein Q2K23_06600 [Enterococcus faecium]|nr:MULTISPECIES: hypothetical protein [Enterococcus]MDO1599890.1 hypothetical protein [Enterococcus faecium]NHB73510.1 hypothetical protein [Enterococcus faecium]